MNYYQHHIGDYDSATAHLSLVEDAIYSRLIRLYYRTEKPLPTDINQVARLIRVTKNSEKIFVERLLSEFFSLTDNGWMQKRCDEEIADYHRKAETNKANGSKGGRPKKQTQTVNSENPEKTQSVILGYENETQTKGNQEPRTNNQEPITKNLKSTQNASAENSAEPEKPETQAAPEKPELPDYRPPDPDERFRNFHELSYLALPDHWKTAAILKYPELDQNSLRDLWTGFEAHYGVIKSGFRQTDLQWAACWIKWLATGATSAIRRQAKPDKPERKTNQYPNDYWDTLPPDNAPVTVDAMDLGDLL